MKNKSIDYIVDNTTNYQKHKFLEERKSKLKTAIIIFPMLFVFFVGLTVFMALFLNLKNTFELIMFLIMLLITLVTIAMLVDIIVEKVGSDNYKIKQGIKAYIRFSKINKKILLEKNDNVITCPNGVFSTVKIGFNNSDRKITFYYSVNKTVSYSYDEISSCNILKNEKQFIQGAAGEALVGGMLFGTIGAIVGASVEKEIKTYPTSIFVTIETIDKQGVVLTLLNKRVSMDSNKYMQAILKANEVKVAVDAIIVKK